MKLKEYLIICINTDLLGSFGLLLNKVAKIWRKPLELQILTMIFEICQILANYKESQIHLVQSNLISRVY